jgi:hypothetical protein
VWWLIIDKCHLPLMTTIVKMQVVLGHGCLKCGVGNVGACVVLLDVD